MNKHTPEPWTIGGRIISINLSHPIRLDLPGNDAIYITGTNKEANAHLIAAVPDLLEALKRLLAPLKIHDAYCKTPCDCAQGQARAAIAKAKGDV